jgi:signal transduction histidine kinase
LGLAMVYSIIEDHSGHMDIISPADTVHNRGARFVITLPRHLDSFMDA